MKLKNIFCGFLILTLVGSSTYGVLAKEVGTEVGTEVLDNSLVETTDEIDSGKVLQPNTNDETMNKDDTETEKVQQNPVGSKENKDDGITNTEEIEQSPDKPEESTNGDIVGAEDAESEEGIVSEDVNFSVSNLLLGEPSVISSGSNGNLKICLGLPDNRFFSGSNFTQGGELWKTASPDDNIGVIPGTSWMLYGWYDTYGSAAYFNADGSPNHLQDSGGLVIAKWNTTYINTFYNYDQYKATNSDLSNLSESVAWSHFLMYGMTEGRRTSYVFSPQMYKNLYSDVANAYGNSGWSNYYMHFAVSGRKEGRWGNYSTMSFDPNGGTCSTKSMLTSYSEAVGTTPYVHNKASLPTPTREGYAFLGWYTANNEAITAGMNCYWINDLTVYAHWRQIKAPTIERVISVQNDNDAFYTYAYVKDNGDGINRVQFPVWTANKGQDDIISDWTTNSASSGTKGSWTVNGLTYNYRYLTKTSSHNNEHGEYYVHVYAYSKYGEYTHIASSFKFSYKVTVNHYKQNVSGSGYSLDSTTSKAYNYGAKITPEVLSYTGFNSPSTQTVTVGVGGNTVNYYYTRSVYTVSVSMDDGVKSVSGAGPQYFGAQVKLAVKLKPGYVLESISSSDVEDPNSFTMPASNVLVTIKTKLVPITVKIPKVVIADSDVKASFNVSANNQVGTVSVEVPSKISFTQEGKSDERVGVVSLSGSELTSSVHQIVGTIDTGGLSAGSWQSNFTIKINYNVN